MFGDVESVSPPRAPITVLNGEEKGGLPLEAFSRVQELFNGVEWVDNSDDAALWLLKQLSVLTDVKELSRLQNKANLYTSPADSEDENNTSSAADSSDEAFEFSQSGQQIQEILGWKQILITIMCLMPNLLQNPWIKNQIQWTRTLHLLISNHASQTEQLKLTRWS